MMLHEHVFLGRTQGSYPQRVCCTKDAREAANNRNILPLQAQFFSFYEHNLIKDVHYSCAAYMTMVQRTICTQAQQF